MGARAYSTKSAETGHAPPSLTHLTASGAARMVTLPSPTRDSTPTAEPTAACKPPTHRIAIAHAYIRFSNATPIQQIHAAQLKKGDVSAVARIAGIMAAKRTSELIPLCHNIPIGGVRIGLEVVEGRSANPSESNTVNGIEAREEGLALHLAADSCGEFGGVRIAARVETFGQTGVEMEALTAANVAALTVYDMCKAVDRGMRIEGCRVVLKEGGKSGTWKEDSASSQ